MQLVAFAVTRCLISLTEVIKPVSTNSNNDFVGVLKASCVLCRYFLAEYAENVKTISKTGKS